MESEWVPERSIHFPKAPLKIAMGFSEIPYSCEGQPLAFLWIPHISIHSARGTLHDSHGFLLIFIHGCLLIFISLHRGSPQHCSEFYSFFIHFTGGGPLRISLAFYISRGGLLYIFMDSIVHFIIAKVPLTVGFPWTQGHPLQFHWTLQISIHFKGCPLVFP